MKSIPEKWKTHEKHLKSEKHTWKVKCKWKSPEKWKAHGKHIWKVKSIPEKHTWKVKSTWKVPEKWKAHEKYLKSEKHMKCTPEKWKAPDWKVKSTWKAHLTGEKHMKITLKVKNTWKALEIHVHYMHSLWPDQNERSVLSSAVFVHKTLDEKHCAFHEKCRFSQKVQCFSRKALLFTKL